MNRATFEYTSPLGTFRSTGKKQMRIAQLPFIFAAAIPLTHAWTSLDLSSRRVFVTGSTATVAAVTAALLTQPVEAAVKDELLEDLRSSKERMAAIPALLDEKEWDKVRTILKLPPVNKLWNLGDVRHNVASVAPSTVMHWLTTFSTLSSSPSLRMWYYSSQRKPETLTYLN
jgi:hypothetical protein